MTHISPTEFVDWKKNPITIAFFQAVHQRIVEGKDTLAGQAGINPIEDAVIRGIITGLTDVLNVDLDEMGGE